MLKNKISRNAILYSKNHIDADKKIELIEPVYEEILY